MGDVVERGGANAATAQEAFRLRMEDQCRQIRSYRKSVLRNEGRLLSLDEAALEWIERYAATFAEHTPG